MSNLKLAFPANSVVADFFNPQVHKSWTAIALLLYLLWWPTGSLAADELVINFEDYPLAANSYTHVATATPISITRNTPFDGVITEGGFGTFNVSGAKFTNLNSERYPGSWDGFAISSMTDVITPGPENQFSSFSGGGFNGSNNYAVGYGYWDLEDNDILFEKFSPMNVEHLRYLPSIELPVNYTAQRMMVTNTTYTVLSLLTGDTHGKKFGGTTGDDPDYLKLSIFGIDSLGNAMTNSIEFFLADYRSPDNSLDYITSHWTHIDLTPLQDATSLHFNVSSSDVGLYGMNSPAYFALDNLTLSAVPEPSSLAFLSVVSLGVLVRRKWSMASRRH